MSKREEQDKHTRGKAIEVLSGFVGKDKKGLESNFEMFVDTVMGVLLNLKKTEDVLSIIRKLTNPQDRYILLMRYKLREAWTEKYTGETIPEPPYHGSKSEVGLLREVGHSRSFVKALEKHVLPLYQEPVSSS